MKITHYDLFAGIGGFSYALDQVFYEAEIKHIFSEWESFPTAILKKHWPEGVFYGDIADLIADTEREGREGQSRQAKRQHRLCNRSGKNQDITILTGGFPCQPFSQAGQRKGTADDRYKWPDMLAVIRNTKPDWIIAENVRGLVTWNDGMVLETVCADLESQGYEVQPLIIPAVAVGAPHRRDRVWIIGHTQHNGQHGPKNRESLDKGGDNNTARTKEFEQPTRPDSIRQGNAKITANSKSKQNRWKDQQELWQYHTGGNPNWDKNWQEVALTTCHDSVDDGLSRK